MEIRPSSEIGLPDLLKGALQALEENVDKTQIEAFEIASAKECEAVAKDMIEDKRQIAMVEDTLKDFKALAFRVHRTITSKENEYAQYGKNRYAIRDRAVSDWTKEQERKQAEEDARLREVARIEDENRKKAEAAELERRAKAEKRPDLKARAEEIRNEPQREIFVSSGPKSAKPNVKGFGVKDDYNVNVLNEDALILAIGRRPAYLELAKAIAAKFGKKKSAAIVEAVAWIMEQANELPQIPTNVVKPHEPTIKANAKATKGKINWPGVAIELDRKSTTRIR